MRFVWKSKFIFWNFIALLAIKAAFAYPTYQLLSLVSGIPVYTKEDVISETNNFRSSIGLAGLKESGVLDIAAAQKLQDMIGNQYFAHFSPAGVTPWHWFEVNKYSYTSAGENLAIGFLDAKSTVQAWSNSPSHRQNMANSGYQEIGVAVADTKIKDIDGIVVVQFFGSQAAPKAVAPKPSGLTLGFSKSTAADKTPTPKPAPKATPKPKPVYKPTPKPTVIGQSQTKTPAPTAPEPTPSPVPVSPTPEPARTKEPAVSLIYAGPDATREAKAEATEESLVPVAPKVNTAARVLNGTFILYSLVIALVSVVYLMFGEVRRDLVLKTAVNFGLFALAVALPVIQVSRMALIL